MIIYPAIDLRHGRCVRLRQGDPDAETVFGEDPAAIARHWVSQGAEWLHVVNLDGALGATHDLIAMVNQGANKIEGESDVLPINLQRLMEIRKAVEIPIQF